MERESYGASHPVTLSHVPRTPLSRQAKALAARILTRAVEAGSELGNLFPRLPRDWWPMLEDVFTSSQARIASSTIALFILIVCAEHAVYSAAMKVVSRSNAPPSECFERNRIAQSNAVASPFRRLGVLSKQLGGRCRTE